MESQDFNQVLEDCAGLNPTDWNHVLIRLQGKNKSEPGPMAQVYLECRLASLTRVVALHKRTLKFL